MSKARLHLIRCSGDIEPEARARRRERRVHLSIIDGGRAAIAAERQNPNPWEALLDLRDLAVLVSQVNYLAFVGAGLTALELHGWTDPKQTR
ncbi:hypothetical protein IVB30_01715 [Bradyrhizobium sp. 200]|uniref:hypothetical protein n=1 Tax=Bradyrhizobium sp. 200 TaxID=2782665 RepID=UPI001FFEE6AB|nr:hypothetical protein [Bradyrhizobium sp. 200]UPJ50177.1 hypothetical protein IVB30_01715 [Bradyrhizobium sp. 200]